MTVFKSLKRCLTNINYLTIFALFLLLVLNSLRIEYFENIGLSEFFIRTASEVSFLQNNLTRHYMTVLTVIGPLLAMISCSLIYANDYECNMLPCIYIRTNLKKYHISNMIAVFLSAFLLFFIPLIISYLISLIACPIHISLDNMTATPSYVIEYTNDSKLDLLRIFNPVSFTVIHIIITSFIFSLFACCGYIITMCIKLNKYISISVIFFCYVFYNVILSKIGYSHFSFFNIIDPYADKISLSNIVFLLIIFSLIIIITFYIMLNRRKA